MLGRSDIDSGPAQHSYSTASEKSQGRLAARAHGSVAKIAGLQFCLRAGPGGSRTTRKTLSRTSPVWVRATTGGDHPFAGGRHPQ